MSELSLRLPSAISATLVVLIMYIFSLKILKNRWIGLLSSLIILSSMGFPDIHIGRTGDYDALLTLFVFIASIFTFLYIQDFKKKYLYLMFLFWVLAIMTKSIAGLLFIPGVFIFTLFDRKLLKLIKQFSFWKTLLISVLVIGGYYIDREFLNHGYLSAVWKEEIWGRIQNNLGANDNDFWYYWKIMASFRFQKWIYFLPISIIAIFLTKDKIIKKFIVFSFLLVVTYFIIISKSGTKQLWYDAQLYPVASLLVATLIVLIIKKTPFILKIFPIMILCFYMQRYIRTNIAYIHRPDLEKSDACLKYGYLFRDKSIDKNGFIGVHKASWCTPALFYFENNSNKHKEIDELVINDKAMTCDSITFNEIKEKNKIEMIFDNKDGCLGFKIKP